MIGIAVTVLVTVILVSLFLWTTPGLDVVAHTFGGVVLGIVGALIGLTVSDYVEG